MGLDCSLEFCRYLKWIWILCIEGNVLLYFGYSSFFVICLRLLQILVSRGYQATAQPFYLKKTMPAHAYNALCTVRWTANVLVSHFCGCVKCALFMWWTRRMNAVRLIPEAGAKFYIKGKILIQRKRCKTPDPALDHITYVMEYFINHVINIGTRGPCLTNIVCLRIRHGNGII